jgi:hypothetical protein
MGAATSTGQLSGGNYYYAGGGGGNSGLGGVGGGGGQGNIGDSAHGAANTGGGGQGDSGIGGSGIVIIKYPSAKTITIGAGLTGTSYTSGEYKYTKITAGTGNVSWA